MHPRTSWYFFYCFLILWCSLCVCIYACFPSCAWNVQLLPFIVAAGWAKLTALRWCDCSSYLRTHTHIWSMLHGYQLLCKTFFNCMEGWMGLPTGRDPKCSTSDGPAFCYAFFSILIALFPERERFCLSLFFFAGVLFQCQNNDIIN